MLLLIPGVQRTGTGTRRRFTVAEVYCVHSVVRTDCLGCLHGHAGRLQAAVAELLTQVEGMQTIQDRQAARIVELEAEADSPCPECSNLEDDVQQLRDRLAEVIGMCDRMTVIYKGNPPSWVPVVRAAATGVKP